MLLFLSVLVIMLGLAAVVATVWLMVLRNRWQLESLKDAYLEARARYGYSRTVSSTKLFEQIKASLVRVVLRLPSGRLALPDGILLRLSPGDFARLDDQYGWDVLAEDLTDIYMSYVRKLGVKAADRVPDLYLERDENVRSGWVPPARVLGRRDRGQGRAIEGPTTYARTRRMTYDESTNRLVEAPLPFPPQRDSSPPIPPQGVTSPPLPDGDVHDGGTHHAASIARPSTRIELRDEAGTTYAVQPGTTLGRAPDCTICLESKYVSARHARIVRSGAAWTIEDLKSSNGTFVNDALATPRAALAAGDVIQLGRGGPQLAVTVPAG